MNSGSPSISHPVPMIASLVALIVIALCVAVLVGSAVPGLEGLAAQPEEERLLAPFRWSPLARGLA
jgi:hypothetical protein